MKKTGFTLLAIAAVLVGLIVGTLNPAPVNLDLLWVQLEIPLGLAILLGFSLGLLSGLSMIYLLRVLPLNFQLRKAKAAIAHLDNDSHDGYGQDNSTKSAPDD